MTSTGDEEQNRRDIGLLKAEHRRQCFNVGDHPDEVDTPWSRAAWALAMAGVLQEQVARLEKERDEARDRALAEAKTKVAAWMHPRHALTPGEEAVLNHCVNDILALRTNPSPVPCEAHEVSKMRRAFHKLDGEPGITVAEHVQISPDIGEYLPKALAIASEGDTP